jgi:hypothetical protein
MKKRSVRQHKTLFSKFFIEKNGVSLIVVLIVATLCSCASGKSTYNPQHKFSPDELMQDADVLWQSFKKCHPGLYWYTSKDTIDAAFENLTASITDSMTEGQFRNLLSQKVALIKCGHTSIRASKAASRYREKMRSTCFPLQVKTWGSDSMIVLANAFRNDSILVRGTSIQSINGLSVKTITDSICHYISGDGYHNSFRYQLMSNNFPAWYRSVFGVSETYQLEVTTLAGLRYTVTVHNYDPHLDSLRKKWQAPVAENKPDRYDDDRKLTIDTARNLAIMELNTFSKARLRSFFNSSFTTLREQNIKYLAIELRENGGGNILNSIRLARYLSNHPFKVADTVAAVSLKYPYPEFVKLGWIYKLQAWFVTRKMDDGRLHYRMYEKKYFKPYKTNHFNGQVFIITGGYTFSASTLFISPLTNQKNISIVGEETGGDAYGNSAVNVPDLVLPNTGLLVRLPLYRIVVNKNLPHDGNGILPTVPVPPTSWHLAHRIDPKMMKVYELIDAQK